MLKIKDIKVEGYWYSEHNKQYPMPIPNILSQEEAEEIYGKNFFKKQSFLKRAVAVTDSPC